MNNRYLVKPYLNPVLAPSCNTFSAKEKDTETGYSYFGARYYDSEVSVWLSVDPMSDERPSISPFAYCQNNPIMLVDPTGMLDTKFENGWTKEVVEFDDGNNETIQITKADEWATIKSVENVNAISGTTITADRKNNTDNTTQSGNSNQSTNSSIKYSSSANRNTVSQYSEQVLMEILIKSGNNSAVITSTTRTPQDQARIMYDNINSQGNAAQKALYGPSGDKVIDQYPNKNAMLQMILTVGPSKVSKHCADPSKLNVIDIAPSSIKHRSAFINTILNDPRISKFLYPRKDPAFHLEIPQPK